MRKIAVLVLLMMQGTALSAAHAEPVPQYALDKDYENCMGGQTVEENAERGKFCDCMREKMNSWDLDTYGEVATEQAKNPTDTSKIAQKIGDLAKVCLAQAFQ